jgi:hypothetical protein
MDVKNHVKKRYNYLILVFFIAGVGCSTINRAYFDDYGRLTPVKSKFKIADSPRDTEMETSIKTDVIYLQKGSGVNSDSDSFIESDFWIYIRFLPNGEFHSSSALESLPDKFNCMLMPRGFNGYWKTLNDSIIRVEYFSPREFNCYIIEDYMIDENGRLVELRSRIRSFGTMWRKYQNSFYDPIEVENLPDSIPR